MRPLALIVENDAGTRKLLDVLLSRHGCEVDVVANGLDALLLLEKIDYDVVVVDLITPGASGADILEWLCVERPAALRRTIVMSSASPAHLERVRNAYPVYTIRKPFDLAEMTGAVATARMAANARGVLGAADEFARRSITAGAKSGVLVRADGATVSLVHDFGYRGMDVQSWFPLPVSAHLPLCTTIRAGAPQWIASLHKAAAHYPTLAPVWQQNQSFALASVPVIRDGAVIGAAGWTFREPHMFDSIEQHAFMSIAADAVTAIDAVIAIDA